MVGFSSATLLLAVDIWHGVNIIMGIGGGIVILSSFLEVSVLFELRLPPSLTCDMMNVAFPIGPFFLS